MCKSMGCGWISKLASKPAIAALRCQFKCGDQIIIYIYQAVATACRFQLAVKYKLLKLL